MKFPGDRLSVTLPRGSNYFAQKSRYGSIIYVSSNIMQIVPYPFHLSLSSSPSVQFVTRALLACVRAIERAIHYDEFLVCQRSHLASNNVSSPGTLCLTPGALSPLSRDARRHKFRAGENPDKEKPLVYSLSREYSRSTSRGSVKMHIHMCTYMYVRARLYLCSRRPLPYSDVRCGEFVRPKCQTRGSISRKKKEGRREICIYHAPERFAAMRASCIHTALGGASRDAINKYGAHCSSPPPQKKILLQDSFPLSRR